jgi:hypothetical protein
MKAINKVYFFFTVLYCGVIFPTCTTPAITVTSIENRNKNSDSITLYTDDRSWYFKVIDGKLYKRLYDNSLNEWVSDWIYVKDV